MNYDLLKESLGISLVELDIVNDQLPQIVKINGDIFEFAKKTNAPFVLLKAVTVAQYLKSFFKNSNNETSTFIKILKYEQQNITNKINNAEDANTLEFKNLSVICDSLSEVINSDYKKDFVEYEIFVPFDGVYYTIGKISQPWVNHKQGLHKAEIEYFSDIIAKVLKK